MIQPGDEDKPAYKIARYHRVKKEPHMNIQDVILELPEHSKAIAEVLSDKHHKLINLSFSSTVLEGQVKHYALVIWEDQEEDTHWYIRPNS